MTQPRLAVLAILGLTSVTAAGFALQQYRRAESLARQLADAETRPVPASRADAPGFPASDDAEVAADAVRKASASLTSPETDETPDDERPARDNGRRNWEARMENLLKDPQIAAAMQLQQRSRLDRRYADLFARLNLPPEKLAQLQDLLVEKQNVARDVFSAAREQGMGRDNRDEIRALIDATQEEIDAEIRSTIGDQAFNALTQYEQTSAQRGMIEQLESRLSYSGTPLNQAQAETLVAILSETSATTAGDNGPGFFPGGGSIITDAAIARAQGVLSADQLAALQALQAEQQAGAALRDAMREQRRNGPPAMPLGPPGGG